MQAIKDNGMIISYDDFGLKLIQSYFQIVHDVSPIDFYIDTQIVTKQEKLTEGYDPTSFMKKTVCNIDNDKTTEEAGNNVAAFELEKKAN